MGKSVDDLLKAIQQEYKQPKTPQPSTGSSAQQPKSSKPAGPDRQGTPTPTPSPGSATNPEHTAPFIKKANSIDDLLDDLGVAAQSSTPPSPPPFSTVRDSSPYSPSAPSSSVSMPSPSVPANKTTATDSVLNQVKQHYVAEEAERERQRQEALEADRRLQQQLAEQARQQQIIEARRQQELEEQRKAERLKNAETWLNDLDPNSDEGFWFESFAINYPSKLEAALDYLDAMEQS